jgi:hypothetical protein
MEFDRRLGITRRIDGGLHLVVNGLKNSRMTLFLSCIHDAYAQR